MKISRGYSLVLRKFFFILALFLSGCATLAPKVTEERKPASLPSAVVESADPLASQSEIDKIIEEANPVLSETGPDGEKIPLHIPIEINRKVAEWIKYFTVREREMTQRYLERGEALRPHLELILKENDVPAELFYLAMIESGFVTHARSRAKAVGVWQFMPGTAKNYGLAVNSNIDERRNWIKATEAAATYLKDLNNVFGSWYLALAAYNAGEYRIVRSIMKGKTRDFWALAEAGLLPQETLNYVPKFLAAHIVGRDFKKYGFEVKVEPQDTWDDFETVNVPSGVRLKEISKVSGISHEILKRWNFDLIRDITPKSKTGSAEIYLPKGLSSKIEEAKADIEKLKKVNGFTEERSYASANGNGHSYTMYVVRKGENLTNISKRLGISVRTLMKINGIKKSRIHPGMHLKYYNSTTAEKVSVSRKIASNPKKKKQHAKKTKKKKTANR